MDEHGGKAARYFATDMCDGIAQGLSLIHILKSFYASVECMERGLDPMNTNLVVADKSRTETP